MERFRREAKELGIATVVNIYERASPGEYYDTSVVIDTEGRLPGINRMMHIAELPDYNEKFYYGEGNTGFPVFDLGTGNAGARLYECSHCLVENNHFDVYGFGILINPQGGVPCGNNVYRYNFMRGNYRDTPAIAIYAYATPIENETFIGNIIASSVFHGVRLYVSEEKGSRIRNVKFINCVINGAKRSGIFFDGAVERISDVLVKNCIISNNGEYGIFGKALSRYNCFWNNGKGDYGGGAVKGEGDISADPLFADPKGGDFHLKSRAGRWDPKLRRWVKDDETSPCIDAGDPRDDFSKEPQPNGGRINMGPYGNTREASKSERK